jgi:hypothetical protein
MDFAKGQTKRTRNSRVISRDNLIKRRGFGNENLDNKTERKVVFLRMKYRKTKMKSKGYGIAWIVNTKEWKKSRGRYSIVLASLQRNAVDRTHQENDEEDVSQRQKHKMFKLLRKGTSRGTHTNKLQKKSSKMSDRK